MNEALDKQLCEKYPKIFKDRHASMQETCMCWGICTGDGWYNILDQLCDNIQRRIDWKEKSNKAVTEYNSMRLQAKIGNWGPFKEFYSFLTGATESLVSKYMEEVLKSEPRPITDNIEQVVASQVKEKFGTLRFYYTGGDDVIDGMVQMAEAMSSVTCEECGASGKTNDGGWLSTRCEAHTNK
jgi:hypothetical protein